MPYGDDARHPLDERSSAPPPRRLTPHLPTLRRARKQAAEAAEAHGLRLVSPPRERVKVPETVPIPNHLVRRALFALTDGAPSAPGGESAEDIHGTVYVRGERIGPRALRALLWATWRSQINEHRDVIDLSPYALACALTAGQHQQVGGKSVARSLADLQLLCHARFALSWRSEWRPEIGTPRAPVTFLNDLGDHRYRWSDWYLEMMRAGLPLGRGPGDGQFTFRVWWPAVRGFPARAGRALLMYLFLESQEWKGPLVSHPAYPNTEPVFVQYTRPLHEPLLRTFGLQHLAAKRVNERIKDAGTLIHALDARYGVLYAEHGALHVMRRRGRPDPALMIPPDVPARTWVARTRDGAELDDILAERVGDLIRPLLDGPLDAAARELLEATLEQLDDVRLAEAYTTIRRATSLAATHAATRALAAAQKILLDGGVRGVERPASPPSR